MISVAEQIKVMMTKKGLTTHALEKQAGLKRGAIQNIIYGRSRNPGIDILRPIAQVLECSISELIGENTPSILFSQNSQILIKSSDESKTLPWNPEIYAACFKKVEEILLKKSIQVPNQKILTYVHEVYLHTLNQKKYDPEDYFVNWLIERFVERKNI